MRQFQTDNHSDNSSYYYQIFLSQSIQQIEEQRDRERGRGTKRQREIEEQSDRERSKETQREIEEQRDRERDRGTKRQRERELKIPSKLPDSQTRS